MRKKRESSERGEEVRRWFSKHVTYEGERYVIDAEQVAAVASDHKNTIVVARAGSGKTRTIVAKIVYLVARCGAKPDEIMAFVFNANAAAEINERLGKIMVDGKPVMSDVKIASTFHAFSRKVVYEVCEGREQCGKILVSRKEEFILEIVRKMMRKKELKEEELVEMAQKMAMFINRAQQQYLAGEKTLMENAERRLAKEDISDEEREFIKRGVECYKKYHWYLLNRRLTGFTEYGTDFNLLVSWAEKLIRSNRGGVRELLSSKKYLLIDEYQDFSQLFLSVVLAIREVVPEVRLFVVGDDLQAINRFAGSDVEYFKNFARYFPEDCGRYEITTNYRCNYMIVDTARKFMKRAMGEKGNFRAFSRRAGRVVLVDARRSKLEYLAILVKLVRENRKAGEILILHRNNETGLKISLEGLRVALRREVLRVRVLSEEEFDAKVRVMTMHKSKGLEAEVVIVLEADEGIIPKVHPDTRLYEIFGETEEVTLDDQKRLFYVAMTRAKKRLYIMHEKKSGRRAKRGSDGFISYLGRGMEWWEG